MIPEVTLEFIAERLLVIQSEQALMRADMVELKGRFGAIEQHVLAIEQHVIALSADAVNLNRRLIGSTSGWTASLACCNRWRPDHDRRYTGLSATD